MQTGKRITDSNLVIVLLVFISGCVSTYNPPAGSRTASLEFFNNSDAAMSTHLFMSAKDCADRVNLGLVDEQEGKLINVVAGDIIVISAGMDTRSGRNEDVFEGNGGSDGIKEYKGCTPMLEFYPEEGKSYILKMRDTDEGCAYTFGEKDKDKILAVPFVERGFIRALSDAGPFCESKQN